MIIEPVLKNVLMAPSVKSVAPTQTQSSGLSLNITRLSLLNVTSCVLVPEVGENATTWSERKAYTSECYIKGKRRVHLTFVYMSAI